MNHVSKIKGKYDNSDSTNRESHWGVRNYRKSQWNSGVEEIQKVKYQPARGTQHHIKVSGLTRE